MSAPTEWLETLTNRVIEHVYPVDVLAPIGCHSFHNRDEDRWEVSLFVSKTEVVGGMHDGKQTASKFALDVLEVYRLFSAITCLDWQTHRLGPEDDLGAHISIEGVYEGHQVWLRILAESPACFEPGRHALLAEQRLENLW